MMPKDFFISKTWLICFNFKERSFVGASTGLEKRFMGVNIYNTAITAPLGGYRPHFTAKSFEQTVVMLDDEFLMLDLSPPPCRPPGLLTRSPHHVCTEINWTHFIPSISVAALCLKPSLSSCLDFSAFVCGG